jgi:hypothetical protein
MEPAMNDRDHHPTTPSASPPSPRDRPAITAEVRPWARAIDGLENPILEMTDEQVAQLERRLGRAIDV